MRLYKSGISLVGSREQLGRQCGDSQDIGRVESACEEKAGRVIKGDEYRRGGSLKAL